MAKLTLASFASLQSGSAVTALNNNFAAIITAFENTLSRDGTSPNYMSDNLDMNSNRISNLVPAIGDTEPVRLKEFQDGMDALEVIVQDIASTTQGYLNTVATIYDDFDDRYLGPKASDPSVDNDGNALLTGALYWNTSTNITKVWTGTQWTGVISTTSGFMLDDLGDVVISSAASGDVLRHDGSSWVDYASSNFLARANHTGTQLLSTISDVTITAANLNTLDDGANTTLHYHSADRARAVHTGTQLASTISDFTEASQDAVGGMVDSTLVYSDATPSLSRAALTGAVTASAGSNTTALGSFTISQLNTAISDADVSTTSHTHLLAAGATDVTISSTDLNTLDDGVNTTLHFHDSDRSRANHTGTQTASTISDFGEAAQDAVGTILVDSSEIDFTYTDATPSITASIVTGSIDETKLDTSVNASLDLADSASQPGHTHTLANVSDVTMTVANLNSLDDGANSTLHFHNTDRDRANHTGTQLSTTISDFSSAVTTIGDAAYQPLDPFLTDIATLTDPGADKILFWDDSVGDVVWLSIGTNLLITGDTLSASGGGGGGGLSDGDYGDITVSAASTVLTIDNDVVTFAKMQNVAANSVPARAASTSGDLSEVALSASQLLGRGSTGDVAAIGLGAGLSMSGAVLGAVAASETVAGVVELATTAEAVTGTDTTRAVTPAGVAAAIAATPTNSAVVKVASATSSTTSSTTTAIPFDNTVPQKTEGAEVMTCTITPANANNKLKIDVTVYADAAGYYGWAVALFKDSDASAIATAPQISFDYGSLPEHITFTHYRTAGSTSAQTFKVRAGAANGTLWINQASSGSATFGGTLISTIVITEIDAAYVV